MIELRLDDKLGIIADGDVYGIYTYSEDQVYFIVKELLRMNGGKMLFRDKYDFILTMQKYLGEKAIDFARWAFAGSGDRDLQVIFTLSMPEPLRPIGRNDFSIVPNEAVIEAYREIEQIHDALYRFSFDIERYMDIDRGTNVEVRSTVLYPTVIGFAKMRVSAEVRWDYVFGRKSIVISSKGYVDTIYPHYVTLAELLTVIQALKTPKAGSFAKIVSALTRAFPSMVGLINPVGRYIVRRRVSLENAILLTALGDLRGTSMVLPVVTPSGVSWRNAEVKNVVVGYDSVMVYYRHGNYAGKVALTLGSRSYEYVSAISEVLDRNEWLKERVRKNAESFLKMLRRYREFLLDFAPQVKLLL